MSSNGNNNITKFDLDLALDTLDLSFNGYIPSKDALEFFVLMRLVEGKDFEFNTPLIHYFIVDMLLGKIDDTRYFPYGEEVRRNIEINKLRVSIMMSRGLAKSSVVTCFFPVYTAIKGVIPTWGKQYFYLGLAASAQGGGRVMAKAIQSMCEDSDYCKEIFESMRFTETEAEFVRKGSTKKDERTFLFRTMGMGTGSVRGVRSNVGNHRPDAIFFDDCIPNTAAAYSEVQMKNFEETLHADAINALKGGGKGRIIMVFTPFTYNDPNVKTITSGAFTPVVMPICKEMHDDINAKNYEGAWPAMHPYEAVKSQYVQAKRSNALSAFQQERMLRLASEEDRMITDDMLQWYDRKLIMNMLDGYNLYITTDFTTTSAAKSDFSGIAVWALNSENDWFLLDLHLKRCELQEQYDALFRMVSVWSRGGRAIDVGVEIDGQQKAHIFSLKQMMQKKNLYFSFARQKGAPVGREGILSKVGGNSKLERFRYTLPMFQNHKIYFPEQLKDTADMKEMMKHLKGATHVGFTTHDDGADLVSQLGLIDVITPSSSEALAEDAGSWYAEDDVWGGIKEKDEYGGSTIF